jgi:hypothetical protein
MASKTIFGVSRSGVEPPPDPILGALHVAAAVPDHFIGGLPVTDLGQLCIENAGVVVEHLKGLPLTATGRLATSSAAISHYIGGWPINIDGRLGIGGGATANSSNGIPYIANGHVNTTAVAPT